MSLLRNIRFPLAMTTHHDSLAPLGFRHPENRDLRARRDIEAEAKRDLHWTTSDSTRRREPRRHGKFRNADFA
ncbi:hypothetical protein TGDOM2_398580, partial [Toxoplasma gondii GAB2-2007-GAL-DOM2]